MDNEQFEHIRLYLKFICIAVWAILAVVLIIAIQ